MKTLLLIICLICLVSCGEEKINEAKYLIKTTVPIKEGQADNVLDLFKSTNPKLVNGQLDWVKAVFSIHEETNTVEVMAYWKDKNSYLEFSNSEYFLSIMSQFRPYFAGQPVVRINKILYEM